jgi:general L-amino acid transport system permease protein
LLAPYAPTTKNIKASNNEERLSMTTLTDAPEGQFRISMLLSDTRYRSLTLQAIAAIALALAIFYLGNNVAKNLAALGLRSGRIMSLVVLPQALRVIIPPLISNYLNITKNSSLAILVGYADVTATLGGITLNQTGRAIECVLLLMLFYLVISLSISAVINVYNNAIKLKER